MNYLLVVYIIGIPNITAMRANLDFGVQSVFLHIGSVLLVPPLETDSRAVKRQLVGN